MAALGNLVGVLQGFQCIWEKGCHFPFGFHVVLAAFVAHTVCVGELLACLEAEKDVVRVSVFFIGVVDVVGGYQVDSGLLVHAEKLLVYVLLFRDPVILKFQKKVAFAEDFLVTEGGFPGVGVHAPGEEAGYFTCQAGAQGDQAFVVFAEKIQVYPGFIIKAFFEAFGYDFHKVLVALVVLCQEYQMVVAVIATADLTVKAGTRGYVYLAA